MSCTGRGCPDCPESPLTLDAVADVMIFSAFPDSNYCSLTTGRFGRSRPDSSEVSLTLMRFDLTAIPPEAILLDVRLEFTVDSCAHDPVDDRVASYLTRPDESFEECTVTWETRRR